MNGMRTYAGWKRIVRRALVGGVLLGVVVAAVLYGWLFADLPAVDSVALRATQPTTQILDRNGKLLYEVLDPNAGKQLDLDLGRIPQACVEATIATEDSRFFAHFGVDPLAIARAAWQNLRGGGISSGASTLTQQLARNLLMGSDERYQTSYRRKLREAYLAWQLERHYSKDELLALYLNQTYYGNFAFGMEAAAQIFFGKPAAQMSRGECTLLAGLVQYPTGYNPLVEPETAKARQLTVLRLMKDAGFIDERRRPKKSAASRCVIARDSLTLRRPTLSCTCRICSCSRLAPSGCARAVCALPPRSTQASSRPQRMRSITALICSTVASPASAHPPPTPIGAWTTPLPSCSTATRATSSPWSAARTTLMPPFRAT